MMNHQLNDFIECFFLPHIPSVTFYNLNRTLFFYLFIVPLYIDCIRTEFCSDSVQLYIRQNILDYLHH